MATNLPVQVKSSVTEVLGPLERGVAEWVNTPVSAVECLGMARLERFCTDPVRPCLVRWHKEAGQCHDGPSLANGWDRESEAEIVPKYRGNNIIQREGEGRPLRQVFDGL